jgi:hypothetical protein
MQGDRRGCSRTSSSRRWRRTTCEPLFDQQAASAYGVDFAVVLRHRRQPGVGFVGVSDPYAETALGVENLRIGELAVSIGSEITALGPTRADSDPFPASRSPTCCTNASPPQTASDGVFMHLREEVVPPVRD